MRFRNPALVVGHWHDPADARRAQEVAVAPVDCRLRFLTGRAGIDGVSETAALSSLKVSACL